MRYLSILSGDVFALLFTSLTSSLLREFRQVVTTMRAHALPRDFRLGAALYTRSKFLIDVALDAMDVIDMSAQDSSLKLREKRTQW